MIPLIALMGWLAAVVPIAIAAFVVVPIAVANSQKTLARWPFAIRWLSLFAAIVVTSVSITVFETAGAAALVAVGLAAPILLSLWAVHRTQDIGWSRWLNLLLLVPAVGLGWLIVLMCVPGRTTPSFPAKVHV
jgi:hypothetical protein